MQNPQLVFAIMDYRMAKAAKEIHKDDVTKMTPEMVALWKEMTSNG